jgi:hypothetical protein
MILQKVQPDGDVGGWYFWHADLGEGSVIAVCFKCPRCLQDGLLRLHSITRTGEVHASVVCGVAACTFHEYVTLADWPSEQFKAKGQLSPEIAP